MSNKKTKVTANLDELNKLIRMLKDDKFLRVGIIGDKATAQHNDDGLTNAELGTYHEFGGTSKNGKEQPPQRSFLSMPLKEQLKFDNAEMKDLKKVLWKKFFVKKSPDEFWRALMSKALDVIEEAFDTEGWGQWKMLTYKTHKLVNKRKKLKEGSKREQTYWLGKEKFIKDDDGIETYAGWESGRQILTDTGKLRRSITAKIMKRK